MSSYPGDVHLVCLNCFPKVDDNTLTNQSVSNERMIFRIEIVLSQPSWTRKLMERFLVLQILDESLSKEGEKVKLLYRVAFPIIRGRYQNGFENLAHSVSFELLSRLLLSIEYCAFCWAVLCNFLPSFSLYLQHIKELLLVQSLSETTLRQVLTGSI